MMMLLLINRADSDLNIYIYMSKNQRFYQHLTTFDHFD